MAVDSDLPAFGAVPSGTVADGDYVMMFKQGQPPGRLVAVEDLWTYYAAEDAEIAALASVTAAADKVPYFTSGTAASTFTVTSAARTFLTTNTSANLAACVSDETGSGLLVFATSPVLTTPNIGTPSAGTLTNCTGLPSASVLAPKVRVLTEVVTAASLTDGGAAVGTKTLAISVPVGAILLGTKVTVEAGYAGDVSATFTIGDGSDVDRYHTGTPSCFATAANGVETGVPSGNKLITTANTPTITVTSNADITPVIAGAGSLTVNIYYIATV